MTLSLAVSPRRVVKVLLAAIACLVAANVVTQVARFSLDSAAVTKLARVFDVSEEANLPTWYQSATLLMCALLIAVIVSVQKAESGRYLRHWRLLVLTFLYLSIDEVAALHDRLTNPLKAVLDVGGGLFFAWVIPASVAVVLFVLAYLKFFLHLRPATRRLVALACLLYVGGALGMEVVNGAFADANGTLNLRYELLTTVEETLEMLGVTTFAFALLTDLGQYVRGVGARGDGALHGALVEPPLRSSAGARRRSDIPLSE